MILLSINGMGDLLLNFILGVESASGQYATPNCYFRLHSSPQISFGTLLSANDECEIKQRKVTNIFLLCQNPLINLCIRRDICHL